MRIDGITFWLMNANIVRKKFADMPTDKSHIHMAATGSFTGRVGHKAGGFIAKKFFHPSNYKNQEKLWQAIEAKKEQEKRQEEFLKKREEEKRIELLKQEMYSGSSSSSSFKQALVQNQSGLILNKRDEFGNAINPQEQQAISVTKKRLQEYRSQNQPKESHKLFVKSRYEEDVHTHGHSSVWGSYYDMSFRQWGYSCCKSHDKEGDCPLAIKQYKHS